MVLLVIVTVPLLEMPPPSVEEEVLVAVFPEMVLLVTKTRQQRKEFAHQKKQLRCIRQLCNLRRRHSKFRHVESHEQHHFRQFCKRREYTNRGRRHLQHRHGESH